MAKSKYIQSVVDAAKGRPKSTQWYRDKIKEFGQPGAMDLIRDGKRDNKPFYGRLNMFFYDPKFKKKLPYYDTFPLVLPLESYSDGFLGIPIFISYGNKNGMSMEHSHPPQLYLQSNNRFELITNLKNKVKKIVSK